MEKPNKLFEALMRGESIRRVVCDSGNIKVGETIRLHGSGYIGIDRKHDRILLDFSAPEYWEIVKDTTVLSRIEALEKELAELKELSNGVVKSW